MNVLKTNTLWLLTDKKARFYSDALLLLWCVLIFVLSSIAGDQYPQVNLDYADKLVHMSLYFWLGVFAWLFFRNRGRSILAAVVFGVFFGLSDELHQMWVPRRTASFSDFIADVSGLALGLTAMYIVSYFLRNKLETSALPTTMWSK